MILTNSDYGFKGFTTRAEKLLFSVTVDYSVNKIALTYPKTGLYFSYFAKIYFQGYDGRD